MELTVSQIVAAADAQPTAPLAGDSLVGGWSIDSRSVASGDLFFAIKGERLDGHAYVNGAFAAGAIAAVVSDPVSNPGGTLLQVSDTLVALQNIARQARTSWGRPLVAVTGSAGKTSTKDMIAQLLGTRMRVGKTAGNLNNHLGLPLSLLRMEGGAEAGVVEMGMNHAGEIRRLAQIAQPQIGVVTNVGYAHIENFESVEGIAAAKRELVEALPDDGVAILNADDPLVLAFADTHNGRTITYGFSPAAEVRAVDVDWTPTGFSFSVDGVRFSTGMPGRHVLSNVLASLAVAKWFDIPFASLVTAVRGIAPGKMRGERFVRNGVTILNDSYNSNPEAARTMIDVLREQPAERRIAVLGEMLELGSMAERLHREVGAYAAAAGINVLIGVRGASKAMVEEAQRRGLDSSSALYFDEPEKAGAFLREFVLPGDAILLKGSRGTRVERVLVTMEN